VNLGSRLSSAIGTLFGFPKSTDGGVMPNFRPTLIGKPYYLDPIIWDHAKAVKLVSTIRACILRKSNDMAAQPVVIEQETSTGWEPVKRDKGNIMDVWHGGNPRQTGREVIRDYHANFLTHGNAYMVAETFGFKVPKELWVMPSHLVRVIPGERRMPAAYIFSRGGSTGGGSSGLFGSMAVAIPAENVIPWHDYQPEDEPIGVSPLDSIQLQYETRYDLMRLFQKVIRAGGVGAGYFSVPQPANGVPVVMTAEEKKAVGEQLKLMRQKFDVPTILDMLHFEKMGLTMSELQFVENMRIADADICRALGVPPWLVNIRETSSGTGRTGDLAQAEERGYWQNLRTELEMRDALLTEKLGPMFKEENIRFRTDLSNVPALNQPLLNSAQQIVALTGRPVFTVNEIRVLSGQPRIEDPSADELAEQKTAAPFGQQDQTGEVTGDGAKTKPADTKPAPEPGSKAKRLIDTPERTMRWRKQDKLMKRYERKFAAAFVGLIRDRKKKLLSRLEAGALRALKGKRTIDLEELFAPEPDDEANIHAIYESLIAERGAEAAREIALELEVNLKTQTVARFIKIRENYGLTGSMDTLMQEVRATLAEGVTLNESLSQLTARVAEKLDEAEQGRALTIARTETLSAYNFAGVEAWRQSGDVEELEWLSARDEAVRPAHADADGEVAGINDGFDVDGETLEYPGDPNGSPENTINCRCIALPVVSERAMRRRGLEVYFPSKNGHAKPTNRLAGVL
jgi:SPP1 gp7 family putative phage head morphogenesis protein